MKDHHPGLPESAPPAEEMYLRILPDLKRIASRLLAAESGRKSLSSGDIVGQVYVKVRETTRIQWQSDEHLKSFCVTCARRYLVDRARKDPPHERVSVSWALNEPAPEEIDTLDLNEAMTKLQVRSERAFYAVEMWSGGMTQKEIAGVLELSIDTVKDDLELGRMFLRRELQKGLHGDASA